MKTLITIIVLALVAWGVYALVNRDGMTDTTGGYTQTETQTYATPAQTSTTTASSTPGFVPEVKAFTVKGSSFAFAPSTLTVNKGDRVRITFQNTGGTHDWVIDEFNARTKTLQTGQSETIEFVADKTGSFEYYCSVGTHRQMGMRGTLTVK